MVNEKAKVFKWDWQILLAGQGVNTLQREKRSSQRRSSPNASCFIHLEYTYQTQAFSFVLLLFIDFREGGSEGERNNNFLFYLFMYSLLDSCMSYNQGLNTQPWHIGKTL